MTRGSVAHARSLTVAAPGQADVGQALSPAKTPPKPSAGGSACPTLLVAALGMLLALPLMANITGTVNNLTTGKPQADIAVKFYRFGQTGMELVAGARTDAEGKFSMDQEPSAQGPSMLRVEIDDVTYNHMMPPGSPSQGLVLDVYNASTQPGPVKVSKHMILFQPAGGEMAVNETFVVVNPGKTTWRDPVNGTLRFYLPPAAKGEVEANGKAPDGLSVPAPTDKTSRPDVYTAKFEIKPGETRLDLTYTVPYTDGEAYSGKVITKDENTYLIAPNGVKLEGAHLEDLGQEPRTQASIYGLSGDSYSIKLTGAEVAAPAAADTATSESGPQIEEILPRINRQQELILGLALGILALGFAVLYRASGTATDRS